MELQKCKECGNLFVSKGRKLCSNCYQQENENFRKIRDHLWENPGATIDEIHQATEISKNLIRKFVRQGRFKRG